MAASGGWEPACPREIVEDVLMLQNCNLSRALESRDEEVSQLEGRVVAAESRLSGLVASMEILGEWWDAANDRLGQGGGPPPASEAPPPPRGGLRERLGGGAESESLRLAFARRFLRTQQILERRVPGAAWTPPGPPEGGPGAAASSLLVEDNARLMMETRQLRADLEISQGLVKALKGERERERERVARAALPALGPSAELGQRGVGAGGPYDSAMGAMQARDTNELPTQMGGAETGGGSAAGGRPSEHAGAASIPATAEYDALSMRAQELEDLLKVEDTVLASSLFRAIKAKMTDCLSEIEQQKRLLQQERLEQRKFRAREQDIAARLAFAEQVQVDNGSLARQLADIEKSHKKLLADNAELRLALDRTSKPGAEKSFAAIGRMMGRLEEERKLHKQRQARLVGALHDSLGVHGALAQSPDVSAALEALCPSGERANPSGGDKLRLLVTSELAHLAKEESLLSRAAAGQPGADTAAGLAPIADGDHSHQLFAAGSSSQGGEDALAAAEKAVYDALGAVRGSALPTTGSGCSKCPELSAQIDSLREECSACMSEMDTIALAFEEAQGANIKLVDFLAEKDEQHAQLIAQSMQAKQALQEMRDLKDSPYQRLNELNAALAAGRKAMDRMQIAQETLSGQISSCFSENESLSHNAISLDRSLKGAQLERDELQLQVELLKGMMTDQARAQGAWETRAKLRQLGPVAASAPPASGTPKGSNLILEMEIEAYKQVLNCAVCGVNRKDCVLTTCFHVFCKGCIDDRIKNRLRKCPGCSRPFGTGDVQNIYL